VTGWIDGLFTHYTAGAGRLLTLRPEDVAPGHDDPAVGGWRAWALADALDRAGERERAVVWINVAIRSLGHDKPPGLQILKAEVFATAGQMALDRGDVGDSIGPLLNAEAQWAELGEMTDAALADRSSASLVALAGQLRGMAGAVDPGHELIPHRGLQQDDWLVGTWWEERLPVRRAAVAADAARAVAATHVQENLIEARRICGDARDWLTRTVSPGRLIRAGWLSSAEGSVSLALLSMTEGNIGVEAGDVEGSVETFGDAIARLRPSTDRQDNLDADPDLPCWPDRGIGAEELSILGRLLFNQGNSYLRLERYADARRNYEECDGIFGMIYEEESRARVRQADELAQSRQQGQAGDRERPPDGTRQHIIEAERAVARGPDRKSRFVDKAPIVPAYRLLLGQLADRGGVAAADDYLRLIAAMREPESLADLPEPPAGESGHPAGLADRVFSPLQVLDAQLRHRPGTTVFVVQSGAEVLTYLALPAGQEALEDRLLLGVFQPEFAPAALRVIEEQTAELDAIVTGRLPACSAASAGLAESCRAAWTHLPERLRECLLAAETIVYAPDPFGSIDEIPLELFLTDDGWLAGTHVVARQVTVSTLLGMLSPNRLPSLLSDRAYLIRAQDPPEFDPLPHADQELRHVTRCMGLIGLAATTEQELTTDRVGQALNAGYRVLHYVGHGIANTLSEGLPLSRGEFVQPRLFSALDGFRTPFLYLSACEVGRSRYVPGGRSAGIAARAVEKGAPAVIGALQAVPDAMGPALATAFYRAARDYPVGEALRLARARLEGDGYNPACLGLFVQYGDPSLLISPSRSREPVPAQVRTESWPAHLTRWLAARRPQDRDQCLARLRAEMASTPDDVRAVSRFISEPGAIRDAGPAEVTALCERISRNDLMGAAAVRLLLAMETLQEQATDPDQVEREFILGLQWSAAMHDGLAWAAFATYGTRRRADFQPGFELQLLEESEGILKAWAELAPEYAALHAIVTDALSQLRNMRIFEP
jgi:hypothetical protein